MTSRALDDALGRARDANTSRHRDAVRVLQIMHHAGKRMTGRAARTAGVVTIIKSEKKLNALDFWMRYPDYLVNELLTMYEDNPIQNERLLEEAIKAFEGTEPELRWLAMLRNWFGAYGALDDAIAILVHLGLVKFHRDLHRDGVRVKERSYHLLQRGADLAIELAEHEPLSWYSERAKLVAVVAQNESGNQLKARQHKIATYHNARHGDIIEPIREIVAERLQAVRRRAAR
jgi:hypothetical protein